MNRNEFLYTLERSLGNIRQADKIDILYDYKEHFNAGLAEGKSEEDICMALGDPRIIAKQYRVDHIVQQADENRTATNIFRAVCASLTLGFVNLVIILPVFFALLGVLLSLYGASLAVTLGGLAGVVAVFLQPFYPGLINPTDFNKGVLIFASVGTASLGLLMDIGCFYVTRFFYHITIKYIKANIKIISK